MNLSLNLDDAWNYILGTIDLVGLVALRAVGQKKAVGWLWAMFTQAVWIVYSLATLQWGFLVPAVIKFIIYTWNWLSWARSDKAEANKTEPDLHDLARQLVERACPDFSLVQREQYSETFARLAQTAAVYEASRRETART
jgi:hypothetical protein